MQNTAGDTTSWHGDALPPGIRAMSGFRVISRRRKGEDKTSYFNADGGWQDDPFEFDLRQALAMFEKYPKNLLPTGVTGGLLVDVYRDAGGGDCSAGGVTSKFNRVILIGPGIEQVFAPTNHDGVNPTPVVVLMDRVIFRKPAPYVVPLDGLAGGWYMYGGNLIACSDSRFPWDCLKVHDRREDVRR